MLALYLTIWAALVLFAIGETGRSIRVHEHASPPAWGWWAFVTGLALAVIHTLLAFDLVHGWVHDDAVRSTATQTEAVFGVAAGWGVYVNYVFLTVWLGDAWAWRAAGRDARPRAITWALRAFYVLIIFNGAVVFASGARRILGLLIVSWLVRVWTAANPVRSSRHR